MTRYVIDPYIYNSVNPEKSIHIGHKHVKHVIGYLFAQIHCAALHSTENKIFHIIVFSNQTLSYFDN